MSAVARGASLPAESRGLVDLLKLPSYVPAVEWNTILAAEH
jgi:hypothetical protein